MYYDRKKLPVFHEKELQTILQKFNLFTKMQNNELLCYICEKIISKENFGCIFLTNKGTVEVSCSNPECLEKVYEVI